MGGFPNSHKPAARHSCVHGVARVWPIAHCGGGLRCRDHMAFYLWPSPSSRSQFHFHPKTQKCNRSQETTVLEQFYRLNPPFRKEPACRPAAHVVPLERWTPLCSGSGRRGLSRSRWWVVTYHQPARHPVWRGALNEPRKRDRHMRISAVVGARFRAALPKRENPRARRHSAAVARRWRRRSAEPLPSCLLVSSKATVSFCGDWVGGRKGAPGTGRK